MSTPAWLSNPQPSVAAPTCPPPQTDAEWAKEKIGLCRGLIHELRQRSEERGDAADEAAQKVRSWVDALLDHPKHGRNWLAKHGDDLKAMLAPFFPAVFGAEPVKPSPTVVIDEDDEVEGDALAFVLRTVFPDAVPASEMDRHYGKRPIHGSLVPTDADGAPRARARDVEPERRLF